MILIICGNKFACKIAVSGANLSVFLFGTANFWTITFFLCQKAAACQSTQEEKQAEKK